MEETLGKRIVHNRKRLGLTQDQLADRLGVTAQAVSKWENDQSCPDISILPKLSDIFGISTDELLGREAPAPIHQVEVIDVQADSQTGRWEFHWDSGRRNAVGFAVLVLAVGILSLCSNLFDWNASFWEILWPTAIVVFGLFGKGFSFFRLGCVAVGAYFLLDNLDIASFDLGAGVIFPALVILFGLALLADALKKPRNSNFRIVRKGSRKKQKSSFDASGEEFTYNASFGEVRQDVALPRLSDGEINVSFGEFTVDLSGVETLSEDCSLEANCSFGELRILVPRRFTVQTDSSASFAEISVKGEPDPDSQGILSLEANASFGEITVQYI